MGRTSKIIGGIIIVLLLLLGGRARAASINFTDSQGQWWQGKSDFSVTIDWSDGFAVTAVNDVAFQGAGAVTVDLQTDRLLKHYELDGSLISSGDGSPGPDIQVTYVPIFSRDSGIWANSDETLFIAWDLGGDDGHTIMFYCRDAGEPAAYAYLGMNFAGDVNIAFLDDTTATLTAGDGVDALYDRHCGGASAVPVPAPLWLLGSGLLGLLFIRRNN